MSHRVAAWLFLAPHFTLFTLLTVLPLLSVFGISLYDWSLLGERRFVGIENFRELSSDAQFWRSVGNTFAYGAAVVPLSMAGGLALALALNRPLPGRTVLRAAFYAPGIISGVAVAVTAGWLFNDHFGVVNALLERVGLPRQPWLSSTVLALPALVAATVWVRVGFCMVIYLAALQDIPAELHEAAHMDGASAWRRFRYVTWPMLRHTTFFLLVMNTIYSFQVFDLIYVMTAGGPAFSTTVMVQFLYDAGFSLQRHGYAAAIALVLYALILGLTVLSWRLGRQGDARP